MPPPHAPRYGAWSHPNPWSDAADGPAPGASPPPPRRNPVLVWGIVGGVVWLALVAVLLTTVVDDGTDPLADDSGSYRPAGPPGRSAAADVVGVPPSPSPPETVLDACDGMMPVLIDSEWQLLEASSEAETMQIVADMHAAVVWAGGAPDALFQEHLRSLADDLQSIIDATGAREEPPGLAADIEDHSFVVGKDCGMHGWTEE